MRVDEVKVTNKLVKDLNNAIDGVTWKIASEEIGMSIPCLRRILNKETKSVKKSSLAKIRTFLSHKNGKEVSTEKDNGSSKLTPRLRRHPQEHLGAGLETDDGIIDTVFEEDSFEFVVSLSLNREMAFELVKRMMVVDVSPRFVIQRILEQELCSVCDKIKGR